MLHHYKDGMLNCEAVVPVKDCTERTNLRKSGSGDIFFGQRYALRRRVTRERELLMSPTWPFMVALVRAIDQGIK